jgi:O-antigen ligase
MTTALYPAIAYRRAYAASPRSWPASLVRGLLFLSLFSIIFLPEFVRDGETSIVYTKAVGGFRFVDLAILFLAFSHFLASGCLRRRIFRFPPTAVFPGLGFLVCVSVAVWYGHRRGGSNFFFDWRGLALGVGLYFVWASWLGSAADVSSVIRLFAVYMAARVALLYILYGAGYRENLLGVAIPIFDGPVLSCTVFAALLAFSCAEHAPGSIEKLLWGGLALATYLIVLMCFRRTYWGELGIGTLLLLWLQKRHRVRNVLIITGIVAVAACILGASFSSRVQSLDVTRDDSEFSADNADHLHDLMDAWYQVQQSPVMGIGVGTSYSTWHIRSWKTESVMVHNAPLHVWLKYGIAGLLFYLWFHFALLRWLFGRAKSRTLAQPGFFAASFAYLTAQFVITLTFAPWPYSELQLTTLTSFILAAAVAADQPLPSGRQ